LRRACPVAHEAEGAEQRGAEQIADDDDGERLQQTETQLIGAMFAPVQIQNWSNGDDVRCATGTGSIPWASKPAPSYSEACVSLLIDMFPPIRRIAFGRDTTSQQQRGRGSSEKYSSRDEAKSTMKAASAAHRISLAKRSAFRRTVDLLSRQLHC
jgi:hypothetical protein